MPEDGHSVSALLACGVSSSEAVRDAARRDLVAAASAHSCLEAEVDLLRARLADAELKLKLRTANSDAKFQADLKAAALHSHKLKADCDRLQAEKRDLQHRVQQQQSDMLSLNSVLETKTTRVADLEGAVAGLEAHKQTMEDDAIELKRQLALKDTVATKAAGQATEAAALAQSESQRVNDLATSQEALRTDLAATRKNLLSLQEQIITARGEAEMASERLSKEAAAHRLCKAKLLVAMNEQRNGKKHAAMAEGNAAAAEAALTATRQELDGLRKQHAAATERLSEAEARAEYLRSVSAKERDKRQQLIDEAKATYARRVTGTIVRLVVVAPTVRVQMPPAKESQVRPRLPVAQLRAVLRDDVLPPFIRIFRREDQGSRAGSASLSKARRARSAQVSGQEPWLQDLVRDLESGIEHQLRETFADLGVGTVPELVAGPAS